MIALHAIWSSESKLRVWGEDSSLTKKIPSQVKSQPQPDRARPHPFACDSGWLREAVLQVNDSPHSFADESLTLLLPSAKYAPQASPHLLPDEDTGSGDITGLAAWIVPALALDARDALDFLLSLPVAAPRGESIGVCSRLFGEAPKLSLDLAARGRALPTLVKSGDKFKAMWRPAIDNEDDAERLRLLMRSMPALCRAEFVDGSTEGRMPDAVLNDLIEQLVNAAVVQAIGD